MKNASGPTKNRTPTDYTVILKRGKENAVSTPHLMAALGYESVRALRKDIERSRMSGQIICSSPDGGYFLPANQQELREYVRTMRAKAIGILTALKSAYSKVCELDGQIYLDELTEELRDL